MLVSAMVSEIKNAGGIDLEDPDAQILSWINERHKQMCARSNWTKMAVPLAALVADENTYDIDADTLGFEVAEIHELRVDGTPYTRTGTQSMWDLEAANTFATGTGGFYAPMFDPNGNVQLVLYPAPAESGATVEALCTIVPADLAVDDTPLPPSDFHRAILEGALADALALLDENLDAADRYDQRFEVKVEELRRRQNRRFGGGPHFVQLEGVHFRR
jgi:hypothetical protein